MSRAPDHATFVASLRREVSAFSEFLELLSAEQECLVRAQTEPLSDITRRKAEKAEALGTFARLRCAFLESHALESNSKGMRQWIASQSDAQAAELRGLWEKLSAFAADAERINRTNGTLINSRMTYTRDALCALNGLTRSTGVYGRDGSTSVGLAHRDFGAA
ncbi:MAG: flagella synthesis protein FlgN [Burkholderiales bacterium]